MSIRSLPLFFLGWEDTFNNALQPDPTVYLQFSEPDAAERPTYYVQSRPLVRSAFCPTKIDHTSGLTLQAASSLNSVIDVGEVLLWANEDHLGADKAF